MTLSEGSKVANAVDNRGRFWCSRSELSGAFRHFTMEFTFRFCMCFCCFAERAYNETCNTFCQSHTCYAELQIERAVACNCLTNCDRNSRSEPTSSRSIVSNFYSLSMLRLFFLHTMQVISIRRYKKLQIQNECSFPRDSSMLKYGEHAFLLHRLNERELKADCVRVCERKSKLELFSVSSSHVMVMALSWHNGNLQWCIIKCWLFAQAIWRWLYQAKHC